LDILKTVQYRAIVIIIVVVVAVAATTTTTTTTIIIIKDIYKVRDHAVPQMC